MGLMDIGQNNPYARINPLAAMIEQGMGGWNTERDRYQKLQNERLNQQQQAALLEMKQQEADRANEQDILNSKAQQALQERLAPKSAPMQMGLLGNEANSPYGGVSLIDPASLQMPQAMVDAKPMDMNETRNFILSHAGTPSAETAYKMAQMGQKDELNASKLDNLKEMLVLRQDMQQQLANAKNEVEREKIKASYDAKILGYENALKLKAMPSISISMRDPNGVPSKVLPANQLEALADMKQARNVLASLDGNNKVNTGPVVGRAQTWLNKVGMASEDFTDMEQKLASVNNIMLKLRSGQAVTEAEHGRFLKEMPTVNDPPTVRAKKLSNAVKYADNLLSEKVALYSEGGYRVPTSLADSAQPTKPKSPSGRPLPKF